LAHWTIPAMQLPPGDEFRGCTHSLMFRLPCSLDLQTAPTAAIPRRAARPFTPRIARNGYPSQDVVSLRVRYEQMTRLDFHQLDCSLVGCSSVPRPGQPPSAVQMPPPSPMPPRPPPSSCPASRDPALPPVLPSSSPRKNLVPAELTVILEYGAHVPLVNLFGLI